MKKLVPILVVTTIVVSVALHPVFVTSRSFEPASMGEARDFVYAVGAAIKRYAYDHNGRTPKTLRELYPDYTRDARVTYATVRFDGELAALDYRQPNKLGDVRTLVLETSWLNPQHQSGLRPVKLWGDLHRPTAM